MKVRYSGVRLVLYSSENDGHLREILAAVPDFFPSEQVTLCADSHALSQALQDLLSGYGIVLLMLRGQCEIDALMPLRDRLMDQSVILILDNAKEDLTQQALKLYPRYTSCFKDQYGDIFLVVDKMITKIETTIRRQENG